MNFGKKLQTLRVTNSLTQHEIARKLNVSQPVYSRYESGEKEVKENDDFVKRVAEMFDVTRKWLLDEDDLHFIEQPLPKDLNTTDNMGNYYALPKDFMDVYFIQQQQMLEKILTVLAKK